MSRPITTSVQFLSSEDGRTFARSMVDKSTEPPPLPAPKCTDTDDQACFEQLLEWFLENMAHEIEPDPVPDTFEPHLREVYEVRFLSLIPAEAAARLEFMTTLIMIARFLARLTFNVWRLDIGALKGHPKPTPGRKLQLYHLQWARECFGWWRASVERLPYYLVLSRPCPFPDPSTQALLDALTEEEKTMIRARSQRRGRVEVEDGCPVC